MWLSRITQEPPTEMKIEPKKWWGEPIPNFSGTPKAFKTYSTTVSKLQAWEPTTSDVFYFSLFFFCSLYKYNEIDYIQMTAPTRQEIHSLYRSYLRIVREWPSDKIRPNRGMKQILAKRVEETFRAPNTETIDIEKAHKELDALESLLDNTFKEKCHL
ncbi:hypothetical protein G6F42_012309 [Rhizopus arrhizus]|nr:hypothetical protein G6F42_012309 [Rhizopus arrhizus]